MKSAKPDILFDEATHTYTVRGKVVPSVTTVLSRVGVRNAEGYWRPVGFDDTFLGGDTAAADFGTAFHKVAAAMLRGQEVAFPDALAPWVEQFKRFVSDFGVAAIKDTVGIPTVEYPLYSDKYKYCGTVDAVTEGKEGKTLLIHDWKTATGKSDSWALQLAAYSQLVEENFGCNRADGVAIMVGNDDYRVAVKYRGRDGSSPTTEFSRFLSCLNVYKMGIGA